MATRAGYQSSCLWLALLLMVVTGTMVVTARQSESDNEPQKAAAVAAAASEGIEPASYGGHHHHHHKYPSKSGHGEYKDHEYKGDHEYVWVNPPPKSPPPPPCPPPTPPPAPCPPPTPPTPPPPPCPFCPNNLTECLGLGGPQCLDLESNPFNCGECGKVCPENSVCSNGTCTCDAGFDQCGSLCVDLTSNDNYCGNCSIACNTTTQYCNNTVCVDKPVTPVCPDGETQCFNGPGPNGCVNLDTNPDYCGSCRRQCRLQSLGVSCNDGKCCKANGDTCIPGLSPLCCGWNPLTLLPLPSGIPLETSKCEQRGLLGVCCKDVFTKCTDTSECCKNNKPELECTSVPVYGKTCQPNGCKATIFPSPAASCTADSECCAGFRCVGTGLFKYCLPIPF